MKKPIVINEYRKLYEATAKLRVLNLLIIYPDKEFSLSDLAKEAKVAKANLSIILKWFEQVGIIEITKLNIIWRIKANQKNENFTKLKIATNLSIIYLTRLTEILNGLFENPKAIILFGSYRKGEDITGSDIDIAVETYGNVERTEYLKDLIKDQNYKKQIEEFEDNINRRIQIHIFNRKKIDKHLFNNIANGIVLSGFLEVKP